MESTYSPSKKRASVLKEYYSRYLTEIRGLSKSSVKHYLDALNNISRRLREKNMIQQDILNPNEMYKYDDADMISMCRNSEGFSRDIMERIDNRQLLKVAKSIQVNRFENPEKIFKIDKNDLLKAEEEISQDYNIERDYLIINLPEYPSFDEMKTWVSLGDKLYHLNEISSIVGALSSARFNSPDICLYVPKEDLDKTKRIKLENYLDLPEEVNKFDTIHFDQSKLFD